MRLTYISLMFVASTLAIPHGGAQKVRTLSYTMSPTATLTLGLGNAKA